MRTRFAIPSPVSAWWRWGQPRAVTRMLLFGLPAAVLASVLVAPATEAAAAAAVKPAKSACPTSLPDENAAVVTARICGGPVAIDALTSETNEAVATASGAVHFSHHFRPVRIRQDGRWLPVNTELAPSPNRKTVEPGATTTPVMFSGGGTGPMVTVATDGGTLSVGSPVGELPAPTLAGDTATYAEVLPGVDLQLRADVDGYAEVLVVKNRQAAENPELAALRFSMSGKGLSTTADKAGNLRISDAKGRLLLAGNTPLMWDTPSGASGVGALVGGQMPGQRHAVMHTTVTGRAITVTPNAAMLADPATTFPVYLDPGITANRSSWAQVDSRTATTAYWNGAGDAQIGTPNAGTDVWRSYFTMDLSSTPVAGKYVSAATLNLNETYSGSCTASQMDLYATSGISSATTWNNQPGTVTWQSAATVAKGFSGSCPAGTVSMDATDGVRTAANAAASVVTLGLAATNEAATASYKKFGNNPTLDITYTAYPTTSALSTSPSTPCTTGSSRPYLNTTTPLLQARITDPEGALVRPEFSWSTTAGAAVGSAQPSSSQSAGEVSGQTQGTTIPAGQLSNGSSYAWKVRGFDGTTWGPWSATCEFTVDTTAPSAAPTVSSGTYPSGTWGGATGTAGTFILGANAVTDVAAYLYGLDTDPAIVVNAPSLGASTAVPLTPASDGPHTLKVQSRDRGGNLSAITSYSFNVGAGAVTAPTTGTQTAAKVTLSGIAKTTTTGVTYQWRRGDADTWNTIPANDVNNTGGGSITWPVATTGSGNYPDLVWNVAQTVKNAEGSTAALDGPLQIRASFAGTGGATSSGVSFTLDQNKTDAASTDLGPGTVNLLTGNYTISSSDADTIGGLGIGRTFNSRLAAAADPMFGPGWTSSIAAPDAGTYTELTVTGSLVQAGLADGGTLGFTKSATTSGGATFTAEVGADNTTLTYTSSTDTYVLTEQSGDTVTFTRRTGDPTGLYTPSSLQSAGTSTSSSISWQKVTIGGVDVVRPIQVLAQVPSGVTCSTLVKGCRAMTFTYATTTTATTGTPGDYIGRLQKVELTAWDPDLATPAMRTVALQQYAYDSNGRLAQAWDPRSNYTTGGNVLHVATAYTYNTDGTLATVTPAGEQAWSFTYTAIPTDNGAGRLYKVTRSALTAGTSVQTVVYNIPISGSSAPVDMAATINRWGQTAVPVDATSVYPGDIVPDGNPATGALPSNTTDDRVTVHYMDPNGREINAMQPGGAIDATFYDASGHTVRETSASNITNALYASTSDTPAQEAAIAAKESITYTYSGDGQRLLETLQPEQDTVLSDWSSVRGRTHTVYTYDEGAPSGGPYNLATTQTESLQYVVSGAAVDTDKRTTTNTYDWTLRQPVAQTVDPNGLALVSRTSYDGTTGAITSTTTPAGNASGTTPSTRKVIAYRSGTGSGVSDCDNHPEWALLPCLITPGAQPATGNEIPSVLTTYDLYGQTRTAIEKNNSSTLRTTTVTYDGAGRRSDISINSSLGTSIPRQHTVYDQATGYITGTQSLDGSGNVTASISRGYDTLGRPTSYTDADNSLSTTAYDALSRPATTNDGKATQTFTYNGSGEKRGLPTQVVDGQAGTFTATYNGDGAIDTETRPDGLTIRHYYNENGAATGLEYVTSPTCSTSSCTLYYDYTGSDTHDKVRWDSSSFSNGGYGYDDAGRLTGARQDTTNGCTLRQYAFDNASNRTKFVSYNPATGGGCQDSNPTNTRTSTYDSADRATSAGYTYDALGRTLTVPDEDTTAGDGAGDVTDTYYTNDLAKTITQATTTNTYTLDVLTSRFRGYNSTVGSTTTNHTNHYSSDTDSPSWINDGSWYTRVIPGLAGVAAYYTGSTAHLEWQITNLHGDVVAMRTAGATGLTATYVTDEFGNAAATPSPRYGYLGGAQRSADNPGGLLLMGVRLYNPTTGRFLQVDPIYGGSANAYDYASQDPVNGLDLSGTLGTFTKYAIKGLAWAFKFTAGKFCRLAGPGWGTACSIGLGGLAGVLYYYVTKNGNTSDFWGYLRAFTSGAAVAVLGQWGPKLAGFFFNTKVGDSLLFKLNEWKSAKGIVEAILRYIK